MILRRLWNLWLWSDVRPTPAGFKWNGWVEPAPEEKDSNGSTETELDNAVSKGIFIPRMKEDPMKRIIEENIES